MGHEAGWRPAGGLEGLSVAFGGAVTVRPRWICASLVCAAPALGENRMVHFTPAHELTGWIQVLTLVELQCVGKQWNEPIDSDQHTTRHRLVGVFIRHPFGC